MTRLKLIACYRGDAAKTLAHHIRQHTEAGRRGYSKIAQGPLAGCYRGPAVSGSLDRRKTCVFKVTRGCVLELRSVIRFGF